MVLSEIQYTNSSKSQIILVPQTKTFDTIDDFQRSELTVENKKVYMHIQMIQAKGQINSEK